MFIFNTTFSIQESVINKGLKYIQTEFIPNLEDDGFMKPLLLKIHNKTENDGYENYAVQFIAPSHNFILNWKKDNESEYNSDIRKLFGENVLTFSTIMETI